MNVLRVGDVCSVKQAFTYKNYDSAAPTDNDIGSNYVENMIGVFIGSCDDHTNCNGTYNMLGFITPNGLRWIIRTKRHHTDVDDLDNQVGLLERG